MKKEAKSATLAPNFSVLLLVDFINPLEFDGAEQLAPKARRAAQCTAILKKQLRKKRIPCIYANDNFGIWKSDFKDLLKYCRGKPGVVAQMAELLVPEEEDLTILKPRHSAFYGSPLDLLLKQMKTEEIIITGLSTDICVQLTAMDGFLRGFSLKVPADCVAAENKVVHKHALQYMARVLKCDITSSA